MIGTLKNKIMFYLCMFMAIFSGVMLLNIFIEDGLAGRYWEGISLKKEDESVSVAENVLQEYQSLYEENSDIVGWLKIEDTAINYPIMQTKDTPEYYLRRNFNKEDDSKGTPFVDYRCEVYPERSFNIIVYGHYSNSGGMFRWLLNYASQKWYLEHKIIEFDTIWEEGKYEVVATFYCDGTDSNLMSKDEQKNDESYEYYNYIEIDNIDGYKKYVNKINEKKLFETKEGIGIMDEVITLVCCAPKEFSGIEENGRFVVVAKKIN